MVLEAVGDGSMNEILGVGFEGVGFEGGSVKWLMIVEFVFGIPFTETLGVFNRGVQP